MTQQHLSYWIPPISICLIKRFCEVTLCRTWSFIVELFCWSCRSEEKLNHVLKTDGEKLFKNLLPNKIFSKQILTWNFKMVLCLNKGLVWEFLGWKLIILQKGVSKNFLVELSAFISSIFNKSYFKYYIYYLGYCQAY